MQMHEQPASRNQSWGFYGELARSIEEPSTRALIFAIARDYLTQSFGMTKDEARDYLDSRNGRHFADALTFKVKPHDFATTLESFDAFRTASPKWLGSDVASWRATYNAAEFAATVEG